MSQPSDSRGALRVEGARIHNLKGVDCDIPHGRVTVVTGPSGAGKSSLALDTIFAEGQRRFVESMSTYAQQFIQQLERPPVDAIENILPAVALEAKSSVRNARSTVGTLTDVQDLLRLLFTHLGVLQCPEGHGEVRRWSVAEVTDRLVAGGAGERFLLLGRVKRPPKGSADALRELVRKGFFRVFVEGEVRRLESPKEWPEDWDPLEIVLGRFRAETDGATRIADSVEEGFRLGDGAVVARSVDGDETFWISPRPICPTCGIERERPNAALFSFNSPLGACPGCSGFGRVAGIDRNLVVPDPSLALEERPFAPWNSPAYEKHYRKLEERCRERGVPLDLPWEELPQEDREWIWSGGKGFTGIEPFFEKLERKKYKVHVRVLLARYRAYFLCPDCEGARLQPDALTVTLRGETLPALTALSVERLRGWLGSRSWSEREEERGGHLLEALSERLEVLHRVGLDYLTLDRTARTLSGGETQRIHLAAALASGLTGTLYVLDEPTVGLHPRDSRRLLGLLRDLAQRGNTVLVVEHDPVIIRGADHVIELGPGAGEAGGEVVFAGSPGELEAGETLTGQFLRRSPSVLARRHFARRRHERGLGSLAAELENRPRIEIVGATAHNLRNVDVPIPLGCLVAVTGVSGSGKSTLVDNVLARGIESRRGEAGIEPGACRELRGIDDLGELVFVDQRPLGRSSRSIPVTSIGAFDNLRKLYAEAPEAKRRDLDPGHFSFNLKKGRCPECKGTGEQEVDLQFMGSITMTCDRCRGRRFRPEVLAVRVRGRTIAETLDLTVSEAAEVFSDQGPLVRRLELLESVGLGYLRLGQPTSALSVGEAQRLKLAGFVRSKRRRDGSPRLFLFDEPTTGLHLSDVSMLHRALRRLARQGDGVVVVEHELDLVARCDWIVELGPGGGEHGGEVLYAGPLIGFLDGVDSPTAEELRGYLGWERRVRYAASAVGGA